MSSARRGVLFRRGRVGKECFCLLNPLNGMLKKTPRQITWKCRGALWVGLHEVGLLTRGHQTPDSNGNQGLFPEKPETYAIAIGKWEVFGDLQTAGIRRNFANQAGLQAEKCRKFDDFAGSRTCRSRFLFAACDGGWVADFPSMAGNKARGVRVWRCGNNFV